MSTITKQIMDIAADLGYEGATARTVAEAIDALCKAVDADADGGSRTIGAALSAYAGEAVSVPAYVVSFDANTGTGSVAPKACSKGSTITLPDGSGLTPPSEKQFKGWGATAAATDVITTLAATEDTTLYAVWEDAA